VMDASISQTCGSCGAALRPDDRFCPGCGTSRSASAVESTTGSPAAEELTALENELRDALAPTYVLVERIGVGGMGAVYLARQPALRRHVAVKVLSPELTAAPGSRARFEREAQAVAGLSHPNVLSIYGVGELPGGTPYFVMQHVGGKSLAAWIEEEGPLPAEEVRRIVGQVASALAAAHRQGIIHRDIKPANILHDEESGRVLVSDFGIAAVRPEGDGGDRTKLTQTGMAVGTPRYMSPEQLLTEQVTEKTDMYGLGLLGYELLAGNAPFTATTPHELIAQHLRDVPKPISEIRDDVDPELESIITTCLSKKPDQRPTSEEVSRRLEGTNVLLEWPPPGLEALHGQLPRLSRLYGAGGALVALATTWMLVLGQRMGALTGSMGSLALLLAALAGAATLAAAWFVSYRVARTMGRGVQRGFGWNTVLETAADRRLDTGLVIAGMREYAALAAHDRTTLRRWRLARELAWLAAAGLPVPLLLAMTWLGSWGVAGATAVPWVVLGPSVLLVIVGADLARRERRRVGDARRRFRRRAQRTESDAASLVEPWNAAFEAVRRGQDLGRGIAGRPVPGVAAAVVLMLGTFLSVVIVSPLWLVATIGPSVWQIATLRH
ncbi:MAG: serine/threonine-protein kinase, partial [Gemmatimonadales bacterium]